MILGILRSENDLYAIGRSLCQPATARQLGMGVRDGQPVGCVCIRNVVDEVSDVREQLQLADACEYRMGVCDSWSEGGADLKE